MLNNLNWPIAVFDSRVCRLGEGPVWDQVRARVVWVDILQSAVLWRSWSGSEAGGWVLDRHVGAVLPKQDGGWLLSLPDGVYSTVTGQDVGAGDLGLVCKFPHAQDFTDMGLPRLRANDAKVSPDGVAYLGSMPYDPVADAGSAALYALVGEQLQTVVSGVTISNGIAWSPDGSTMYYIDSPTGYVDRCTMDAASAQLQREPFIAIDPALGVPDGMCVDSEGFLWVAIWGGGRVQRFTPDGAAAGHICVPCPQVTSCTFAGPDLKTLVITTAADGLATQDGVGMTYAVECPVAGQPQPLVA